MLQLVLFPVLIQSASSVMALVEQSRQEVSDKHALSKILKDG
jgi:hypothetical protein